MNNMKVILITYPHTEYYFPRRVQQILNVMIGLFIVPNYAFWKYHKARNDYCI